MRSLKSIAPIILAAGDSSRMGYPKALLPLGSETFLTHILQVLQESGMIRPRLILGRAAARIRLQIPEGAADILINEDPDRGQLSSIQIGLSDLPPVFDAAMIWPVDQPAVSIDLINHLIARFIESKCRIALPLCGGKRGHPAIFDRSLFQEFMNAPLGEGPKGIILRYQTETEILPTEELASVQDIDTPAEYQTLTGESLGSALKIAGSSKKN